MFCHKCGKELPDGTLFCGECGAKQDNGVVQTAEAPAAETVNPIQTTEAVNGFEVQADPAPQFAPAFAAASFDAPQKKKKKLWLKLLPAVIALALVAAILLNLGTVIGFGIKTFGSDKAYFGYVEKKAFDAYADDVTDLYSALVKNYTSSQSLSGEMKLILGDDLLQILETASSGSMKLDWLKDIAIAYNVNMNGSAEELNMGLKLGNTEIVALRAIVDLLKGDIYMALTNLSDKYMHIEGMNGTDSAAAVMPSIYGNEDFKKALPAEEALNELIKKYVKIALEEIEKVEKSSDTVRIEGIKESCTTITFTVTNEDLMDIAVAVLEEAKKDSEIKAIIEDFVKFLNDEEILDDKPSDVYDEFVEIVDEAIDETEDSKKEMDKDELENELISVIDYVNGSHEVIGRDFEVGGQKYVSYATARDGSDFATEIDIANTLTIKGSGTDKNGKINGKFSVSASGMSVGDIEIVDFESSDLEEGEVSGTFRFIINKQLLSMFSNAAGEYASLINGLNGVEIKLAGDKESASYEFNVLYNNKTLAGIAVSGKTQDSKEIKYPAESSVVEGEEEYLETIDLDKLYTALEKAGVPSELIAALKSGTLFGNSLEDDYYEDFVDGYEDDYDYDYDFEDEF